MCKTVDIRLKTGWSLKDKKQEVRKILVKSPFQH